MARGQLDPDDFTTSVEDALRWHYGTTADMLRAIWIPNITQGLLLVASPACLARVDANTRRFEGKSVEDPILGPIFDGRAIGEGVHADDPVLMLSNTVGIDIARPVFETSRFGTIVAVLGLDAEGLDQTVDSNTLPDLAIGRMRCLKGAGDLFLIVPVGFLYEESGQRARDELVGLAREHGWLSEVVVYPYVPEWPTSWSTGVLQLSALIRVRKLEQPDPEPDFPQVSKSK